MVSSEIKKVTNADVIAVWADYHSEEKITAFRGWPVHPDGWLARWEKNRDTETPGWFRYDDVTNW